ncbi:MAG: nucleotide exchange factor GrpE [Caldilineae bacterium]|nr:MAG: nucleotide exchange factor GrpE [Caldilineae bacterium]
MKEFDPNRSGPNGRQIRIPVRRGGILPPPQDTASRPLSKPSPSFQEEEPDAHKLPALPANTTGATGDGEAEWKERYLRLQAEVDEMRRSLQKRMELKAVEDKQALLRDLLPLADHLQAALLHTPADVGPEHFRQGIELILRALLDTLRRHGVEPIEALGTPFDPRFHEAMGEMESDRVPPGHVAEVLQNGYTHHGKVLRPARVLVARAEPL